MTVQERIRQLRDDLHRYNHAYYMEDQSLISDFEFDQLLAELVELEKIIPNFMIPILLTTGRRNNNQAV